MATSSQSSSTPAALPQGKGKRVAVLASRFNPEICEALVQGAREGLQEAGVEDSDIAVFRVPGAFELPVALQAVANTEKFDAAVVLGVVIRGETAHFDFVAGEASHGIREVILKTGLPVGFGLLTTETEDQARERAGGRLGNKGYEAALVALEMSHTLHEIEQSS